MLSDHSSFFKAPDYELSVVNYAQRNRQPFGINEAVSGGVIPIAAVNFTGPAMVSL